MASFRQGIDWILNNDDTYWLDENPEMPSVTACMLADIFGKTDEQVLAHLLRRRAQLQAQDDAATDTRIADQLLSQ